MRTPAPQFDVFELRARGEISPEEYVRRVSARVKARREEMDRACDEDTGYPTGASWWKLALHWISVALRPWRWS